MGLEASKGKAGDRDGLTPEWHCTVGTGTEQEGQHGGFPAGLRG